MPEISVIVPCFNEEATIARLLEAIRDQTQPIADIEVVIADGMSSDRTRDVIREFQAANPGMHIRLIDNPRRAIPSGLNRAIQASQGEYLIRLDAHSIPERDYIQRCIHNLQNGSGDNVGGMWQIQPGADSWIARSIAFTASHPLGVGDALYRIGGTAQEVDTVPFGAFKRQLVEKIGMFDESLLSNEDYEFNTRIRQSGGRVWMDPSIKSTYIARSTLKELARQYWRYGYWKAQMLRKYPHSLRWRQAVPPLFVLSLFSLGLLAIGSQLARWLLMIIVLLYSLIIILAGIQMSLKHKDLSSLIGVPLSIATIHLAWGAALLWGLISRPKAVEPG